MPNVVYWNDGTELYHYGVKGQRHGVRRYQNEDGSLTEEGRRHYGVGERRSRNTPNANYSSEQRARDKAVYGRTGVRRINRHMNEGDGVAAARSKEAARINSFRNAARIGGVVGSTAVAVGGAVFLNSSAGRSLMERTLGDVMDNPVARTAILSGAGYLASTLGKEAGRAAVMLSGGYNPNKWRYT